MFNFFKKTLPDLERLRKREKEARKDWVRQVALHSKEVLSKWEPVPIKYFSFYREDKMLELELKIIEDFDFEDRGTSEAEAKKRRAKLGQELEKEWATYSASPNLNAPTEPSPLSLHLRESY